MKVEYKYTRIKNRLESDIRSGWFKNSKLPALKNLCEQYGTSLVTINKVVKLLETEGLVTCYTGAKGTWVNEPLPVAMPGTDEKSDPIDMSPYVNKKVKLKYYSLDYSPATKDMWKEIAALFAVEYPWVEIEVVPSASRVQIDNVRDLGDIDIIQGGTQDLKVLKDDSKIMPLETFLAGDPSVKSEEFLSTAWDACCIDDELMALPMYFSVPLLYYRQKESSKLLEDSILTKGLDWDDFISLMNKAREGGSDASLNIGLWTLWQSIFGLLNAKIFSNQEAEEKLCKSIRLIEQVTEKTKSRFDLMKVYQQRDGVNKFIDGELDVFCAYSFFLNQLKQTEMNSWRACSMPLDPKNGKAILMTAVNAINPASRHKPEAWFFMRFLASERVQKILGNHCYFSVLEDVLQENLFAQENINNQQQVLDKIHNGACWNLSSHSAFVVYHNYIYPALSDYLSHKIDMDEVVEKIKRCFSEILPIYEIV